MVEEIQNKIQLEVDKYKAVQKGECVSKDVCIGLT
jgi:hypothetical protein